MKIKQQSYRRGAASVGLSLMLLAIVTATALTTMRGQYARRKAAETSQSRDVLLAAIDAVQSLPKEVLAKEIRLPIDESRDHWLTIALIQTDEETALLQATETRGETTGLSIKRELLETTK